MEAFPGEIRKKILSSSLSSSKKFSRKKKSSAAAGTSLLCAFFNAPFFRELKKIVHTAKLSDSAFFLESPSRQKQRFFFVCPFFVAFSPEIFQAHIHYLYLSRRVHIYMWLGQSWRPEQEPCVGRWRMGHPSVCTHTHGRTPCTYMLRTPWRDYDLVSD